MPKLDDYDDSHSAAPVSETATASIGTKLSSGASFTPTTPGYTPGTPATPAFGSTSSGFGGTSSFGSSTGSGLGGGSSFGGASAGGFGANNQQQQVNAMQEGGTTTIKTDDKFGDFINSKWRPLMAVIYMVTCTTDFVIFPILWSMLQASTHAQITQWMPLTLQGAGLYHIAMGAVLGLAAYGRSQEKIAGKA